MAKFLVFLSVVLAALVQGYFLSTVFSNPPNLLLAAVFLIAATNTLKNSLAAGLLAGFLMDAISMDGFGLYMVFYVIFVVLVSLIRRFGVELGKYLVSSTILALGIVLLNSLILAHLWVISSSIVWSPQLIAGWSIQIIGTLLFALVLKVSLQLKV